MNLDLFWLLVASSKVIVISLGYYVYFFSWKVGFGFAFAVEGLKYPFENG